MSNWCLVSNNFKQKLDHTTQERKFNAEGLDNSWRDSERELDTFQLKFFALELDFFFWKIFVLEIENYA